MALVAAFPTEGEEIYVVVNKSDGKKVAMPKNAPAALGSRRDSEDEPDGWGTFDCLVLRP
jgi:hypothetical protein